MRISELVNAIEEKAPLKYQESYDNSGLIIGSLNDDVKKALICLDISMDIINEAIEKNCDIIFSHHPLIFNPIKKINSNTETEKIIIKAIKNSIAIYAAHTNLDNAWGGLNKVLAEKVGLINTKILLPQENSLRKLVTFCPHKDIEKLRQSVFAAGAGHIGNYDCCSYNIEGKGSFRGSDNTNPYVGKKNTIHFEEETRFETIFPIHLQSKIIKALVEAHPYEEVAYDIYPLENAYTQSGAGIIGELKNPVEDIKFLKLLKKQLEVKIIKHSHLQGQLIKRVAICSGSGSFLINNAISQNADIFISSEFKHNHFLDSINRIIIADIGHYESEHFAKEIIKSFLIKKFPKFAPEIAQSERNPVYYL